MQKQSDITQITLAVLCVVGLLTMSFVVMQPFLGATIWATMIVIATWPLMLAVQRRMWGKRWIAVSVMTVAALLVFVVPVTLAIGTIVSSMDTIQEWSRSLMEAGVPPPPEWVAKIPYVGEKATLAWKEVSDGGQPYLVEHVSPYLSSALRWLADQAGTFGAAMIQFLLTIVIAAILYSSGEVPAAGALAFGRRLGGQRGEEAIRLAGASIRGVALGVVVTAIVQALLGGIGLAVVGVPAAVLLTAAMFMLCIAQIGAGIVLIPAVIWLFWSGQTGWGIVMLVWSVVVLALDNVLRPILIRRGVDLPLLLIFAGVIGGLLSLGVVGVFVGPVVLAVTFTLLKAWVREADEPVVAVAVPAERA